MKTVLLKTEVSQCNGKKAFLRYRLFAIDTEGMEHLYSEENIPKIIEGLPQLAFPEVIMDLNLLKEKEQELISNSTKSNF